MEKMKLRMYGCELDVSIFTKTQYPCSEYNCGVAVEFFGRLCQAGDYNRLLKAAAAIIEEESTCTADDGPCWCWLCRAGAGNGLADSDAVSYVTGSGHGHYTVFQDGRFEFVGSMRSFETGGEYAVLC